MARALGKRVGSVEFHRRLIVARDSPCEIDHAELIAQRHAGALGKVGAHKCVFSIVCAECEVVGIERHRIDVNAIAAAVDNHRRLVVMRGHGATIEAIEGIAITIEKAWMSAGMAGAVDSNYSLDAAAFAMRAR